MGSEKMYFPGNFGGNGPLEQNMADLLGELRVLSAGRYFKRAGLIHLSVVESYCVMSPTTIILRCRKGLSMAMTKTSGQFWGAAGVSEDVWTTQHVRHIKTH